MLTAVLVAVTVATPVHAEPGGRGEDHGDAFRPHGRGPEAATADYGGAKWVAAHKGNYTNADRPESDPIDRIVVHTMQGSYEGTKAWFRNPRSQVTTHYIIRAEDGEITQMVHESDIAWHAGNWDYNVTSIGIEHEGYVDDPEKWYTDAMYESSAKLVRTIAVKYGIPLDREHVIGHSEVPGADHTDPGDGWDWDRYMRLLRSSAADGEPITLDDGDESRVTAGDGWRRGTADGDLSGGHTGASPVTYSDPLWYRFAVPATGRYRIEVRHPASPRFNDRTPYIVNTAGDGDWQTVYLDQRSSGGVWRSIGEFALAAGDHPTVAVSRWTGGTGTVVADGVRLIPQDG
ncbi:N-acetylmuramoyl-L-alanine amidase [Stackebrandtia albiflava]|uniref:N-acetylmuramoyl-L-alanine amidase n=2 Tax=Stackebrandtia albiflava TaxID=406432 RepID=A0A562V9V0_9ACTN|nr:N-acetylmuramoyl-L-alanine amidase [Stackebrandtia albiflava]